jgi:geranylgeranyl diphosphate synthase, type II
MTSHPIDLTRLFAPVHRIDEYLTTTLDDPDLEVPDNLRAAMKYAVLDGGKRLRPLLCWYCCEALGIPGETSLPACAAIEFVHAFSLVHDDLPALDNDDLRRGKPTLHKHAGESMAILAGDALLNTASLHLCWFGGNRAASLVRCLASSTNAMIAGQVLDTLGGSRKTDAAARVQEIHNGKTAALIMAAATMAYECAGGNETVHSDLLVSLLDYTTNVGLIFQIVDDLIDVEQSPESAGKRTGKDAAAGKLTYPSVLGIEASKAKVRELHQQALDALAPLGANAQPLRDLAHYLATRTR